MNCDRIARLYRLIEYLSFGRALERHRFRYISHLTGCSRALLLGDGDGRFLSELAAANPAIQIDSVDTSAAMLALARERVAAREVPNPSRIHFEQGDAFEFPLASNRYDLVVTNFFFDCFSTGSVARLVDRIASACRANSCWIVSEFQQPVAGWRAWHARLWLATMYRFFGFATGLATRQLPDYHSALRQARFHLALHSTSRAGLLCSEMWRRD